MMMDRLQAMSKRQQTIKTENERKAIIVAVVSVAVGVAVVYGCMWLGCAMDYISQLN